MSDREAGVRLAALTLLRQRVDEQIAVEKATVDASMLPGDRSTLALTDGTVVGSATKVKAAVSWRVTDEQALLRYVQAHHPEEVVAHVNPAYKTRLLADAKAHGAPVDVANGEMVPGVEERVGQPYIKTDVTTDPAAVAALARAATANGEIALLGDGTRSVLTTGEQL